MEQPDLQDRRQQQHVVIIGAGISGLAAAYRLQEELEDIQITVVEAADEPGGKLVTERVDGFTIEHGADVFLARKPWGVRLCRDLGLNPIPTNPDIRGSFVQWRGALHRLPEGLGAMVPTDWKSVMRTTLLSPVGKARLLAEPLVPRRAATGDEQLGHFIRRRFGTETYARMAHPLLNGIFGGDIDTLSLQATFPEYRRMESQFGSVLRGARRRRKTSGGPAFLTLPDGMAQLPETLAERFRGRLLTSHRTTSIDRRVERWRVEPAGFDADAVIITTPAYETAGMLRDVSPGLANALDEIPYNSVRIVSLGYRTADVAMPLNGYGYLVPSAEGKAVRACTWSSSKVPGRAPSGCVLLRLFFGRDPADEMLKATDDELLDAAKNEIAATLGVPLRTEPILHRIRAWDRAQPAYTLGHPARLERIDDELRRLPGIALCGPAYRGIGIPDCIRQAEEAVDSVTRFLRSAGHKEQDK